MIRKYRHLGFPILMTFFACYVLSANVLVPRIVELDIGLTTVVLTTGSIIWPYTAQLIDMINEIYGKRKACLTVIMAYIVNLLFITFIYMGIQAQPLWSTENETFWLSYFTQAPRILFASSASLLICQFTDIMVFARLKQYFYRWEKSATIKGIVCFCTIRSVTSDLVNMVLDGALFAIFAFLFVLPIDDLIRLIIGSIMLKALLAVLDTPWFIAFKVGVSDVEREF
jgi:uncharacterized integral membrane protein (TIGR00697 family)